MDVTDWTYREVEGQPPDGEAGFYLGYDEDGQPYLMRWFKNDHGAHWLALSLDDHPATGCAPVVHAILGNNVGKIKKWARLPLRWSDMGLSPTLSDKAEGS